MSANFYALGPADIFLRFRDGTSAFFGNTIAGTEVTPKHYYNDVMSDLAGRNVPIGRLKDGIEHDVVMTVNRPDYTVYKRLQSMTNNAAAVAGLEGNATRGSFHTGVTDVELIFRFFFPAIGAPVPADSPIGRRYYSATYRTGLEQRKGSRVEELTCMFTCTPLFDPTTRGFSLYTEDSALVVQGLPNIN